MVIWLAIVSYFLVNGVPAKNFYLHNILFHAHSFQSIVSLRLGMIVIQNNFEKIQKQEPVCKYT